MNRWDAARQEQRVAEISRELGRLFRLQTDFLAKVPAACKSVECTKPLASVSGNCLRS